MTTGAYDRLRSWAEDSGESMTVRKGDNADGTYWAIDVAIDEPVTFSASAEAKTIDEAATQVISDLTTVGASIP
jgi:hypothetical protein